MHIQNKIFLFALLLALTGISSCLSDSKETERTEAIELAELNQLIEKLEARGNDIDTTESGVFYLVREPGEGPLIAAYDTVIISYEGLLTTGQVFDASADWAPDGKWEFVYLDQPLIEGFNVGLALMRKGSEFEFIIPSSLAYGAYGSPPLIGPYETLIFWVKIHDIRASQQ